ncbi:Ribonuclease T2 [Mycena indigotica]|uniref:Ribonuclease T2-like n=1 Tax=Mycena indigotica TaxID=2126181 RepID=A0A8H6VZ77_9AGAR|nr:Ribonuclease T2 [Mycena indigotica]KAF7295698.1 Ribonuclease T2 [Mycena indigotica]
MSLFPLLLAALPTVSSWAVNTSLTERALTSAISSGCPANSPTSCGSTTSSNTCCFESPGGLLLQTQFWDATPVSTGPNNSWTIHGLWPDNCDGTFSENCDSSRDYTGISTLLTNQGAASTLSFMNTFWKNLPSDGTDESLWEHEWATHGTCYSTLKTSCLPSGSSKGAEAVAFFETTVKLFQTLPTFDWLSAAGIVPSSSTTYTLSALQAAVRAKWGFTPAFQCSGSTLNGVFYYFNLKGSVIDGTFVPINAATASTCSSTGIKYAPKTTGSSGGGGGGSTGTLPAKATLVASSVGGILSLGTWSTQTLATFTISGTVDSFTMTSSKGNCGVASGTFACGSGVSLTSFSAVSSGGKLLLASGGSTSWTSDATPSGSTVQTVFTGSGHAQDYTLAITST